MLTSSGCSHDSSLSACPLQPYKCEWEECGELFGRRSMLLAHVRARHDGTVKMRVVHSPGGTNQVAEVLGWNGYRTCVAVSQRRARGRVKEEVHDGADEESQAEWGADSMHCSCVRPEVDVGEEKVLMDGDVLPPTEDRLLFWPSGDMQIEYKEAGDGDNYQSLFSTFPSLPSPLGYSSPAVSTSTSVVASGSQSRWPSLTHTIDAGDYLGPSLSVPSSVWCSPPSVSHWSPQHLSTASSHAISAAPSPLFASPMHSPRGWLHGTNSNEHAETRLLSGDAEDTYRW